MQKRAKGGEFVQFDLKFPPSGAIEVPTPKILEISPENRKLYDDMTSKLDTFSGAHATAAIPLTPGVSNSLLFNLGLLPTAAYKYGHSVFTRKDSSSEIHINEMLDENGNAKYSLVTYLDVEGIRNRAFANPDALKRFKQDIMNAGYSITEFDEFERNYMRFGNIHIMVNQKVIPDNPHLLGFMEAAVFDFDNATMERFNRLVSALGHRSAVEVGGMAGPLTGRGKLSAIRLVHKVPPHPADLSIPLKYEEMMNLVKKVH
ncbi:MAG: hypothetical protein NTU61_03425 [Candidatus Altiarchaeota archaeon]|nr:hypothetical protein [Candidatus Altiarchaeota archaeon]